MLSYDALTWKWYGGGAIKALRPWKVLGCMEASPYNKADEFHPDNQGQHMH
jgi:hypothetical protein